MRAHYLQHVPFVGLGNISAWLDNAGYDVTHTHFFESTELPAPGDIDLLIIAGGTMSANDEAALPWLIQEKAFIRDVIHAGKAVLGICLGSQLIASALGARVYTNSHKEIGWFPVHGEASQDRSLFRFPRSTEVFQWHYETSDLPPGAVRLAKNNTCGNQAFQYGQAVIGLQFHLETTAATAREFVARGRADLLPERYVQSAETILAAPAERYQRLNDLMSTVLCFLQGATHRPPAQLPASSG